MNLDQLLQAALPAKIEESKPVGPTLFVGIGGTGKEVLLRLRRLVVERYGSLSALPFMQYIHIDTDMTAAAKEQYDLRGNDDPLQDEVRFKPVERIDLTIDGGTGKYVEHINSYPHIKSWFPSSGKIASLGNLGEGAGQVRIASRLGFYHAPNFSAISARLESVGGQLRNPGILDKAGELGFEFDAQGMNVFVICSIAGGTGGGTFLDMGFLLQRHFPNADRVGIFMLPSFFHGYAGGTRVRANGYAALVELNHYSFGHPFHVNWDGNNPYVIQPPPFSTMYLVDGINESGLVIGSSGKEYDAYQMVSEILFQDFSVGQFSGMKRATRINLVNFNLNVYTHNFLNDTLRPSNRDKNKTVIGETYPTRFGSVGLATIHFPNDRLHSACGARLATRVLDFWQNTLLENPLEHLFTRFLAHPDVMFAQGEFERRSGGRLERTDIEDALLVYDSGGGKTFPSYFWEKAQNIRAELEGTPNKQKAPLLEARLQELDNFFAYEDSDDQDEWGVGVRQIESNMRHYVDRVKRGISKLAEDTANDKKLGVAYTLSLLREFKALLRNEIFHYLPYFESEITLWRDETQEQAFQLDQLKLDISRHERQLLFRADDLNRDMERLVGAEGSGDAGALYSYYFSRVKKQVARRGKQICEEIDAFLGKDDVTGKGLIGRYFELLAGFESLKERLRSKSRYFAEAKPSDLQVSLYREEDADTWYRKWVGESGEEKEILESVGNQLLKKTFNVDSVTAALIHIQKTPVDEIEMRILQVCKSYLASKEEQPQALDLLLASGRYSRKQQEDMVRRAYSLGKVWLKRASLGLDHIGLPPVKPDQRPCLIGVDTTNVVRVKEFKELVREIQDPADSPPSFLNIGSGNRGTIIFYNELAGVPAFYPSAVMAPDGLFTAYRNYEDKEELHIDKNRFQFGDLIPKTTQDARAYSESLKAFVLARLLGLLKIRELRDDSDKPTFHYSYSRQVSLSSKEDVPLGDEMNAVDSLYRDIRDEHLTDRSQLLERIEETIDALRREKLLWIYLLLIEFYLYKVYPPTKDEEYIENTTILQYSPQYAVLHLARSQIEKMLSGEDERSKLNKILEAKRKGKQGEEMSYDEYMAAFGEHVKEGSKLSIRKTSAVNSERYEYRAIPVLNRASLGIEDQTLSVFPPVDGGVGPINQVPDERQVKERPCPRCHQQIDVRAIVCRHCQQRFAEHITCPHCGEQRVPDDLPECWQCGGRLATVAKVECPACFGFTGAPEDFPCPVCGHALEGGATHLTPYVDQPAEEHEAPPVDDGEPQYESSTDAEAPPAPGAAPPGSGAGQQVECPTCFSTVPAGPSCPVCGGLLVSR